MELRKFIATTIREYLNESVVEKNNWYHGSDYKFTSFGDFKSNGPSALGIFLTDDRDLAELFGENVYNVSFNIDNPYKITMDTWDKIRASHAKDTIYFENMREKLIEKGFDSILIKSRSWKSSSGIEFKDGNIIVIFDKNKIKIEALS